SVRRQLLDVEDLETVATEDVLTRPEREVGEVLVVNRVELVLLNEPHQVGELERDDAIRGQDLRDAAYERMEVGDLRQHVVGGDQVGLHALGTQPRRQGRAEEVDDRVDAHVDGGPGDVGGGLHSQHGDPQIAEPSEQVPVVGGELHDQRMPVEAETSGHRLRVPTG